MISNRLRAYLCPSAPERGAIAVRILAGKRWPVKRKGRRSHPQFRL